MPSKSAKQHRFMEMVAHDPKAAKRVGVSTSVGREFVNADKGKKFKTGGEMKKPSKLFKGKETYKEELNEAKAIKSGKLTPKQYAMGEESEKAKMKKGGKVKKMASGGMSDEGYSMGKPPTISEAMSNADDRLGGRNASMTLPGQSRPANRPATGGSGYKPYSGSTVQRPSNTMTMGDDGVPRETSFKANKSESVATESKPVSKPTTKPATKKAAPAPAKKAVSRPTESAASRASRQAAYDSWKAEQAQADAGDELPVGAEAFKKGGKAKCMKTGGSVRGHGAERTGRTRGRYI